MTLAHYRSHKVVMAGAISSLITDGAVITGLIVKNVLGEEERFTELPTGIFFCYTPVVGDYLVIYPPDGYMSISPKQQFEDGYHPVSAENASESNEGPQTACNFLSWAVHNLIMPEDKVALANSVLADMAGAGIKPTET